jgi:hypothetical protein
VGQIAGRKQQKNALEKPGQRAVSWVYVTGEGDHGKLVMVSVHVKFYHWRDAGCMEATDQVVQYATGRNYACMPV